MATPPKAAAGKAAEAPEAVRRRHDGAAELFLHDHRVGVHGDIHAADDAAEQEHSDGRQPAHSAPAPRRKRPSVQAAPNTAHDFPRAVARDQVAAPWHRRSPRPRRTHRISRPSVDSLIASRVRKTGICGAQLPVTKPFTGTRQRRPSARRSERCRVASDICTEEIVSADLPLTPSRPEIRWQIEATSRPAWRIQPVHRPELDDTPRTARPSHNTTSRSLASIWSPARTRTRRSCRPVRRAARFPSSSPRWRAARRRP